MHYHTTANATFKRLFYLICLCKLLYERYRYIPKGRCQDFFFRFGNLHVAKRHPAHGNAMRFTKGVRGHAPSTIFFLII